MFNRTCAECGKSFTAKREHADFCATACKNAYNNRTMQRGKTFLELYAHTRFNRKVASEKGLQTILDRMVGNWVEEDRKAGRRDLRPLNDCLFAVVEHTAIRNNHRAGK